MYSINTARFKKTMAQIDFPWLVCYCYIETKKRTLWFRELTSYMAFYQDPYSFWYGVINCSLPILYGMRTKN